MRTSKYICIFALMQGIWYRKDRLAEHSDDAFKIYIELDEVCNLTRAREYAAELFDKTKEGVMDDDMAHVTND
ncbi:hypothetical protein HDV63DRAFT_370686 [Trichoderma sp. SZMC 28014]